MKVLIWLIPIGFIVSGVFIISGDVFDFNVTVFNLIMRIGNFFIALYNNTLAFLPFMDRIDPLLLAVGRGG